MVRFKGGNMKFLGLHERPLGKIKKMVIITTNVMEEL